MKKANEIGERSWTATFSDYDPECLPVDSVEGLRQVYEDCVEIHMLLDAFLLDHIEGAAAWFESTHGFWQGLLRDRAD